MPTNPLFNQFNDPLEQKMIDDLVIESIKIFGMDCMYIPRTLNNFNEMMGEDAISTYTSYTELEMYVKSAEGFGGDGQFFSKFMAEIRDQVILSVSVTRFNQAVSESRPKEGDLIYFPLSGGLFVIRFVDTRPYFYQFGSLQLYDMTCELFEYSGERFSTGIAEVDNLQINFTTDVQADPGLDLDDKPDDYWSDNEVFDEEAADIIDFDENNPFGDP